MSKRGSNGQGQASACFEEQYRRVFEAAECRTQSELAEVLEVKQSSISFAKRRQSIPSSWRMKLFIKKRINPDWILCGEGGKFLTVTDAISVKPPVMMTEILSLQKYTAQELVNELVRRSMKELSQEEVQPEVANQGQCLGADGDARNGDTPNTVI